MKTANLILGHNKQILNIAVGSKNPVKINAALNGIKSVMIQTHKDLNNQLPVNCEISTVGFDVASEVSNQPFGDEETKTGCINRAKHSFEAYVEANGGKVPDYSVGLEGGVGLIGNDLECFAWIAIFDGNRISTSRTSSFILPPIMRDLVLKDGLELGDADDKVFQTVNSKQRSGTVGKLTLGLIDRTAYYEQSVIMAMIPFVWANALYDENYEYNNNK
eukprot:gene12663-16974_t